MMKDKKAVTAETMLELNPQIADRPGNQALSGALKRLQARAQNLHNSHYTKHGSHSVKHSSW